MVKLLLKYGADPNIRDHRDLSALTLAAMLARVEIVGFLVTVPGIDVNIRDEEDNTPLIHAVNAVEPRGCTDNRRARVVSMLLAVDRVDANAKNRYGQTALMHATLMHKLDSVRVLLACDRVGVSTRGLIGQLARALASGQKPHQDRKALVQMILMGDDVDLNIKDSIWDRTALMWAAFYGHNGAVRLFISKKDICLTASCLNHKDRGGDTALTIAVAHSHLAVVKQLLKLNGLDVNATNGSQQTALAMAVEKEDISIIRLLLACDGIDLNPKDVNGKTL